MNAVTIAIGLAVAVTDEPLVLGGEIVVGEAFLVQSGTRLVQLGLGTLGAGLALGAIGVSKTFLGDLAMGTSDFRRRRAIWRSRDCARMRGTTKATRGDENDGDHDDRDDGSGAHGGTSGQMLVFVEYPYPANSMNGLLGTIPAAAGRRQQRLRRG